MECQEDKSRFQPIYRVPGQGVLASEALPETQLLPSRTQKLRLVPLAWGGPALAMAQEAANSGRPEPYPQTAPSVGLVRQTKGPTGQAGECYQKAQAQMTYKSVRLKLLGESLQTLDGRVLALEGLRVPADGLLQAQLHKGSDRVVLVADVVKAVVGRLDDVPGAVGLDYVLESAQCLRPEHLPRHEGRVAHQVAERPRRVESRLLLAVGQQVRQDFYGMPQLLVQGARVEAHVAKRKAGELAHRGVRVRAAADDLPADRGPFQLLVEVSRVFAQVAYQVARLGPHSRLSVRKQFPELLHYRQGVDRHVVGARESRQSRQEREALHQRDHGGAALQQLEPSEEHAAVLVDELICEWSGLVRQGEQPSQQRDQQARLLPLQVLGGSDDEADDVVLVVDGGLLLAVKSEIEDLQEAGGYQVQAGRPTPVKVGRPLLDAGDLGLAEERNEIHEGCPAKKSLGEAGQLEGAELVADCEVGYHASRGQVVSGVQLENDLVQRLFQPGLGQAPGELGGQPSDLGLATGEQLGEEGHDPVVEAVGQHPVAAALHPAHLLGPVHLFRREQVVEDREEAGQVLLQVILEVVLLQKGERVHLNERALLLQEPALERDRQPSELLQQLLVLHLPEYVAQQDRGHREQHRVVLPQVLEQDLDHELFVQQALAELLAGPGQLQQHPQDVGAGLERGLVLGQVQLVEGARPVELHQQVGDRLANPLEKRLDLVELLHDRGALPLPGEGGDVPEHRVHDHRQQLHYAFAQLLAFVLLQQRQRLLEKLILHHLVVEAIRLNEIGGGAGGHDPCAADEVEGQLLVPLSAAADFGQGREAGHQGAQIDQLEPGVALERILGDESNRLHQLHQNVHEVLAVLDLYQALEDGDQLGRHLRVLEDVLRGRLRLLAADHHERESLQPADEGVALGLLTQQVSHICAQQRHQLLQELGVASQQHRSALLLGHREELVPDVLNHNLFIALGGQRVLLEQALGEGNLHEAVVLVRAGDSLCPDVVLG